MKIHHTTEIKELGNCEICGKPFLNYWKDKEELNGRSDLHTDGKNGLIHFGCSGGKSLQRLNEERKTKNS